MDKYIEGNKAAWEEAFDNSGYPLSMIIQGKKIYKV